MNKLFVRSRGLLVIVALALVAAMCTASTARAASPGTGGVAVIHAAAASRSAAASSAPCNFQATQMCTSTDPTVTVSAYYYGNSSACTFVWNVDWGDGHSSPNLVVTDPANGWRVLSQHTYAAPSTYAILITGQVTAGNCIESDFSRTFTLTSSPPSPVYSPTIYWSRTSGRPGTFVTLTGNGWAPGGTVKVHLPSKGFFIGNSSWHVDSNGGWKQKFTVADTKQGKYTLSFTESSGNLSVSGRFKVPSVPNAGQDWSRCHDGSCTIALDHARTDVLIDILNGTPKLALLGQLFALCNAYTYGLILVGCSIFAAGAVLVDAPLLAQQLSESDLGRGVYITYLTIHFTKLGITPQR